MFMRRLPTFMLALAVVLVLGVANAGGRGGFRVEGGQRFTIRLWAEEVLASWGPFETVAGGELEYDPRLGVYWAPYTGIGYTAGAWWMQAQGRVGLHGISAVLIGGWSW